MLRTARHLLFILPLLTACSQDHVAPNAPNPPRALASPLIVDAAHGGQNAHFYFLPPTVPAPTFNGVFDRTRQPVVEICELVGNVCAVPLVARFTLRPPDDDVEGDEDHGQRPEYVKVSPTREFYRVRWHTNEYDVDPAKTYRIAVLVAGATLGFADVDVVPSKKEARNVNTNEFIPLVEGKTLPIKFRIEQGAIVTVSPGQSASVDAAGGTVSASDGSASVAIPGGAVATPTNISIGASSTPPPNAEGWASVVELGPSGTTFARPVTLTMSYAPEHLPSGVPPSALAVYTFDGTGWEQVPGGQVNETNNTVSVAISHFSGYYVGISPNAVNAAAVPGTVGLGQTTSMSGWAVYHDVVPHTYCYYVGSWPSLTYHCTTWSSSYSYPLRGYAVRWSGTAPAVANVPLSPTYTNDQGQVGSPPITGLTAGFTDVRASIGSLTSSYARLTVLPWTPLPSMPTSRWGLSTVTVGNVIYTIGGNAFPAYPYPGQSPSSAVEAFDVVTAQWSTRRSLPAAIEHAQMTAFDGRIYVFGGWTCNLCAAQTVFMYDPATDSWTQLPDAPYRLSGGVARVIGGKIYMTSGACCGSAGGLHRFDPASNGWTRLASPPHSHEFAAGAGVIGGKFYVAGGESGAGALDVYDPATDSWTSRQAMPVARQHGAGVVVDGKLVIVGGENASGVGAPGELLSYDPATNAWTILTQMLTPRQLLGATRVNGRIYAIGGNAGTNLDPVQALESYLATGNNQPVASVLVTPTTLSLTVGLQQGLTTRAWDDNGGELTGRPTMWSSSDPTVATVDASGIVTAVTPGQTTIIATIDGVSASALVTVISPWSAVAPMLTPRWGMAAVALGNMIYAFGGNASPLEPYPGGPAVAVVEAYDATTNQWTARGNAPALREHSIAAAAGGLIYVIGGWTCNLCSDARTFIYDPLGDSWTQGTNAPFPVFGGIAAEISGSVYVTTSGCCGSPQGGFAAYGTSTSVWNVLPSMPHGHGFLAGGGVINGKLYVAGGEGSQGSLDVYDPQTQTWTTKRSMPVARQHGSGVVYNGKLYIFGGEDAGPVGSPNDVLVYDPTADTWTVVTQAPRARNLTSAVLVNGFMFILGGNANMSPGAAISAVDRYLPH